MVAEWMPAYRHPNYLVSTDGDVYSILRKDRMNRTVGGDLLTQVRRSGRRKGRKGYLCVRLDGQMVSVHRLVLETFDRPASSSREVVRHANDIEDDNRLINLSWGTCLDNAEDRKRNGGYAKKAKCVNGHEFTPENTWLSREGWQQCKTCHRKRERERKQKQKAC